MAELRVKSTGTLKLFESDNTSSVTIASPASLGGDRTITLPDASVTLASGTMLATDGSGANLTALDADNISAGTLAIARGGTGAATLAGAGLASTPAFWVYKATSGQAITHDTWTLMTFQTEALDSDTDFDMSTYKFTPTTAGWYYLFAQVYWSTATDISSVHIGISKNSTTVGHVVYGSGSNYNFDSFGTSCLVEANGSSDYFTATCYQNSGGSINTSADTSSHFGGYKIIGA